MEQKLIYQRSSRFYKGRPMKEEYTYTLLKKGDHLDFYGEVWVAGKKKKPSPIWM